MALINFPVQLTSFIGREQEMAKIINLVGSAHLVTISGPGGSGKTRLAIEAARALGDSFADGVWLVDLAPLREPALVPLIVAQALDLHQGSEQPIFERLLNFVQPKQMLLVLDNCEHLLNACAALVQALLSQAAGLRILATSLEPLAISGEAIYPLSGLPRPAYSEGQAPEIDLEGLMAYDAVRLFVERARAIANNFSLTPENAAAIIEICRRLDGLPLALELASARVNVLAVQQIAGRLNDRFALLTSTQRAGLDLRHQTLHAVLDWSYTLLAPAEQTLLRRLAVFEAGCTLDTAEAVTSGEGIAAAQVLDLISSLVSKSLVVAETVGRSQARYRLLETIREFALEKLGEAGEMTRLRGKHLDLFLAKAEEASPKLHDAYQQLWLNMLEGEHDNLRAALAWSLANGRIAEGLRIATALVRFWEIRGYIPEGRVWFERLLAQTNEAISPAVRGYALAYASFLAMIFGDAAAAMAYGQQAVDLAEAAGDEGRSFLTIALAGLASGARVAGDFQAAYDLEERLIHLLRDSQEPPFFLGMALLAHGTVAIELGDYETALNALDESLVIAREAGDAFRIAHALNALGDLARCEFRYQDAQSAYQKAIALLREIGAQQDLAAVLHNLGHTCLHLGDIERSRALFLEGMAIHQALHNVPGVAECLIGFAAIALRQDLPRAGARLLGAALAIGGQQSTGATAWRVTRQEYKMNLALARERLAEADFLAEQAQGSQMSREQAVAYARNLPHGPEIGAATGAIPGGLTPREREVAALIGRGKTNGEIAAELFLSKRTVETHVSKILAKLELTSRGQIMRWALEHGLS